MVSQETQQTRSIFFNEEKIMKTVKAQGNQREGPELLPWDPSNKIIQPDTECC